MMLAQMENVPSDSLKNVLLIIAGLAATAYYIKEMFWSQKTESLPQPLVTQKIWPSATIRDLETHNEEVKRRLEQHDKEIASMREMIRVELPEMERRITAANEVRATQTHTRINEVLSEVSELRGEMKNA